MELKKIWNGIWKASVGTPEADTPVSLRAFPAQSEQLERMDEAALPLSIGQIVCREIKVVLEKKAGKGLNC